VEPLRGSARKAKGRRTCPRSSPTRLTFWTSPTRSASARNGTLSSSGGARELEDERAAEKAKIASEVDAQVEARVREMTATVPPAADDARYEDDFESPTSPSPKVAKVVESPTSPKAAMVLNPGAGYSIARGEASSRVGPAFRARVRLTVRR
jgi:hypothetical protein